MLLCWCGLGYDAMVAILAIGMGCQWVIPTRHPCRTSWYGSTPTGHTSEIVERSWEMDDDLIVEIWTILNTDLTCILWKTCWTTFVFLYIVLCVCVRQMFLTVYLSNSEKHFTEVPVTPETLCRDVVDVCKEPGETDCYLAESWRGSGEDIYLHTWTDLWISTIQLKHNNAAGLMLYYYKIL